MRQNRDRSMTGSRGGGVLLAFALLAAGAAALTADAQETTQPGPTADCSRGKNLGFEGKVIDRAPELWTLHPHRSFYVTDRRPTNWGDKLLSTESGNFATSLSQGFPTLGGDSIAWEFRYKKGTDDSVQIGDYSTGTLTVPQGVTDWHRFHGTYAVPDGQTTTTLEVKLEGDNMGDSSFDEFVLYLQCKISVTGSAEFTGDTDPTGVVNVGDRVTFTYTTTNTGTASLKNLAVANTEGPAVSCRTEGDVAVKAETVLKPTKSITCTGAYELTQDDIDAGSVAAAATVRRP